MTGCARYAWRLHTQFDLDTFAPHRIDLTVPGTRNAGANREHNVLRARLEAERCYIGDGGYASTAALLCRRRRPRQQLRHPHAGGQRLHGAGGALNCRKRALDAGIVRDAIVTCWACRSARGPLQPPGADRGHPGQAAPAADEAQTPRSSSDVIVVATLPAGPAARAGDADLQQNATRSSCFSASSSNCWGCVIC